MSHSNHTVETTESHGAVHYDEGYYRFGEVTTFLLSIEVHVLALLLMRPWSFPCVWGSVSLSSNWESFISSRSPLSTRSALILCDSMTLTSSIEKEPLTLRTPSLWFLHGGHISIAERILTLQLTFKIHREGEIKWKHTRWNVSSLLFSKLRYFH